MINTGLIKLWNLQLMRGFHHFLQSLKICQLALIQRNLLELFSPRKIAEELGFEIREEPAYEVNGKRNLLHPGMPDNTLT